MSRGNPPHPRHPLVLAAAPHVVEQAARVGVGQVLENAVTDRIAAGAITHSRRTKTGHVYGHGWVASVRRVPSPLTGRQAWRITSVEPRSVRVASYRA